MATTKMFKVTHLRDYLDLPQDAGYKDDEYEVMSNQLVDTSRWSKHYELIFRTPDMAESTGWRLHYSVGATEHQEERPWEYLSEVKATLVHLVEKVVKVWEEA